MGWLAIAALCFAAVFLGIPFALVLWSRRARMHSGRSLNYDGPCETVEAPEAPTAGPEQQVELSQEEKESWDEITRVTWNLPARRDETA